MNTSIIPILQMGNVMKFAQVYRSVCGEAALAILPPPKEFWYKSTLRHCLCIDSDVLHAISESGIWGWEEARNWLLSPFPPENRLSFFLCSLDIHWNALEFSSLVLPSEQLPINFSQPHCSVDVSISRDIGLSASGQLWFFWYCQTAWVYLSYEIFILR